MKKRLLLSEKLDSLPNKPGIYQFFDENREILYIGKAVNLRNRVRQYFQQSRSLDPRIETLISKVADLEVIITDSEVEALILEATLVKKFRPKYNIDLKDDKSYPYIVITNEPYPRVLVTRRIIRDGSKYFGPYTDVKTMRASLKMIRDIFRVRSCNYAIDDEAIRKGKYKVCLDYHIKKCDGPCEGLISQQKYNAMIQEVAQVLKGKTTSLISILKEQMQKSAEELKFEEAAEFRDRIERLNVYNEKQKIVDLDMTDRDLFAIACEGDDACGVVFKVREGKVIGRQHIYMNGVKAKTEAEIVEQFAERFYLESDDVPNEVFLPFAIESKETFQLWLSQKRGQSVKVVVPKAGEKAELMAMCRANAELLLGELKLQKMKRSDYFPHSVRALQRDLRLSRPPRRIECFDVSNIQGADATASLVVFVDGKPKKSEYRRFRIQSVSGPDDFASIREVVERRYKRLLEEKGELPDLILVDGGKGQLSATVEVLEKLKLISAENTDEQKVDGARIKNIPVIGLAKKLEEVYIPECSDPQSIPKTSSGLKLLQQIRDEAHRFAITYHRTLRKKRTLQTELDLIKGIGKKRAKELIEVFGSVQGVKFATQEQLTEVVGEKLAGKILEYFGEENPKEI